MEIPTNYWINQNKTSPKEEIALRLTEAWVSQKGHCTGYAYVWNAYDYFIKKLEEEK